MRILSIVSILCLMAAVIVGQQPAAFEAASIKPVQLSTHPTFGNWGGPGTSDPGRIHLCCVGMFSLLMRAFDVELDQLRGPSWIMANFGPDLYELDATMPPRTTKVQLQAMMRTLLEERFHLQVHREKRNFPGYELLVDEKGAKLKESSPDPNAVAVDSLQPPKRGTGGVLMLPPGPQMFTSLGRGVIVVQAQQKPITDLVKGLGRLIADSLGENPNDFESPKARVIDKTGLTGTYDFTLRFSCEACQFAAINGDSPAASSSDSIGGTPNIFSALQSQLGLKLIKIKNIPLDVIVVDHVDKTPSGG